MGFNLFKNNVSYKIFTQNYIYIKQDLLLNILLGLICHKTTNQTINIYHFFSSLLIEINLTCSLSAPITPKAYAHTYFCEINNIKYIQNHFFQSLINHNFKKSP